MGTRLDLHFGSASNNTTARYLIPVTVRKSVTATEGDAQMHPPIPRGRSWRCIGIYAKSVAPTGGTKTNTYTLRKNGASVSSFEVVITDTATENFGPSGVAATIFSATDLVSVLYAAANAPNAGVHDVILIGEVV